MKQERVAKLASVYAGRSLATDNPDTVVIKALITDRKDPDRPVLIELTSHGARMLAAELLKCAKESGEQE